MSDLKLDKWKGILWVPAQGGGFIAVCPDHRQRLEIQTKYMRVTQDDTRALVHNHLVCPEDDKTFEMGGVAFWMFKRRYESVREAQSLMKVDVYDLDNVYTPVLRIEPKKKDPDLSLQFEIDKTSNGKKIVIYAADRKDINKKSHIFIDPQKEAMTFDGKDVHPNSIFAKIEITYKSGKKTIVKN